VTFSTFREALTSYGDRFAQCKRELRPKKLRAPRSNPASLRTSSGEFALAISEVLSPGGHEGEMEGDAPHPFFE